MPRIHLLDRETAELIAAGEVIERPSSVVKELVENAIDSGATAITVEIQSGGVRFIRVTDNGCGIFREDIPKAFLRHATSKVLSQEDLYRIGTLGFRGEALASICAVGQVELLTRTKEEALGTKYEIYGGVEKSLDDAGCPLGTTIIVRNLFYNVPARMKFLKKDSTEGNAVAALLDRLALSHPEISVRFLREGQRKLHTPGDGKLLSAVYAVYGGEFGSSLVPVEGQAASMGGLALSGFITKPECAKASRAMEHFFINRRYVKSVTMMAALEEAYKNSLMTGKFPGCVLNLEIPFGMVDVNVHPAKLEVKLSDERMVFNGILNACKGALASLGNVTLARDTGKQPGQGRISYFQLKNPPLAGEQQRMTPAEYRKAASLPVKEEPPVREKAPPVREKALVGTAGATVFREPPASSPAMILRDDEEKAPVSREPKPPCREREEEAPLKWERERARPAAASPKVHPEPNPEPKSAPPSSGTPQAPVLPDLRLIGELFGTYILAEGGEELLLVDKHAAHERILFERLRAEQAAGGIPRQLLLSSVQVSMPKDRYDALVQTPEITQDAAPGPEDVGDGSVLVREVPSILEIGQVEDAVLEMAELLLKNHTKLKLEFYDELYHSIACKGAVKGRSFSSPAEQQRLLDQLAADPGIRNCPHGRPVMIAITRRELEKMFGRIV